MTRDQIIAELMRQVSELSPSVRLREDVRQMLESCTDLTLQHLYARNVMPVLLTSCLREFLSGAIEVPEVHL